MLNVLLPLLVSFFITVILGPVIIPFLRKLKVGNTEREELESHQIKTGTPTMGGIMMLITVTVISLFYAKSYPRIIPVLILTLGFGLIGFLDDYLKVVKRNKDGLIAWQKLILQIILTAVFAFCVVNYTDVSLEMIIPFTGGKMVDPGILTFPIMFFAIIGTVNGTNFTDGLDGLASTVTAVVAAFFTFVSLSVGGGVEPICAAMFGALLGFLVYNVYPASVFMGDTGSLALGGFVAGTAYMMQMPLFIIIVGLIYLVEVVSVILQVGYFKLTHGKRIFRMAPIHHHFELGGWSETRVVAVFSIITILVCAVAYFAM